MSAATDTRDPGNRHSWPFFSTPLRYFLWVVVPVCVLMAPLAFVASRWPLRASAAVVLFCSGYAATRGYLCRVLADHDGVRYRSIWREIRIAWPAVRLLNRYSPGTTGAAYVFITTHGRAPRGRWEIDDQTIQLQDRPGLLETLQALREAAVPGSLIP